jgi:hypothetical protein
MSIFCKAIIHQSSCSDQSNAKKEYLNYASYYVGETGETRLGGFFTYFWKKPIYLNGFLEEKKRRG